MHQRKVLFNFKSVRKRPISAEIKCRISSADSVKHRIRRSLPTNPAIKDAGWSWTFSSKLTKVQFFAAFKVLTFYFCMLFPSSEISDPIPRVVPLWQPVNNSKIIKNSKVHKNDFINFPFNRQSTFS